VRDEIVLGVDDDFYDVRQWSDMGRCLFQEDGFSIFFVKKEQEVRVWVGRRINCLVQGDSLGGDTK
jgi:hypothetical protein